MTININLILQQEIAALRAENKRKKKKKVRRQATLKSNIILNIQEGRDRVEQLYKQLNKPTPAP
jgi:hypothetical protein